MEDLKDRAVLYHKAEQAAEGFDELSSDSKRRALKALAEAERALQDAAFLLVASIFERDYADGTKYAEAANTIRKYMELS